MFSSRSTQAAMQSRHLAAAFSSLSSAESAHASALHRALLRLFHSRLRWQAAAKRPGFAALSRGLINRSRWKPGINSAHSHTPSSVAAAIATAARLVALRISLRTAVLAHVSFSFCMSPSSLFCLFGVDPNGSQNFGRLVNDRV